jgi:hypothetical protein
MTDKSVKLSKLGQEIENTLAALLKEVMAKPKKGADGKIVEQFTLTDKMKVLDRALKLEAIKAKADGDEGGFFTDLGADDESE